MKRKSDGETTSKLNERTTGGTGGPNPMRTQTRVEEEVEKTLLSFDRLVSPKPRADFYARVQARIRNAESPSRRAPALLFRRRVLVPAVLAVMIVANVITAVLVFRLPDAGAAGRQKAMAALAEEYGLESSAVSSYWK